MYICQDTVVAGGWFRSHPQEVVEDGADCLGCLENHRRRAQEIKEDEERKKLRDETEKLRLRNLDQN